MSIEKVRDFFGIKYLIPYDITTKKPKLVLRAIGEISYETDPEAKELLGGHTEAPLDVEYGQPSPVMSGTVREYPAELFELMDTVTVTENAAESGGSANDTTNNQGTSMFNGSNGISAVSVNASSKANVKFGQLVFVATAAQVFDIYVNGLTDSFENIEGLAVIGVDASAAGTVTVTALGIDITVVGTSAFVTDDTMSIEMRPENTGSTQVLVGAGTTPSNFGVRCIFPRKTDGVLHHIDVFNVSGRGMPWKGTSREWSEFDIGWKPIARPADGAVYNLVRCLGV